MRPLTTADDEETRPISRLYNNIVVDGLKALLDRVALKVRLHNLDFNGSHVAGSRDPLRLARRG